MNKPVVYVDKMNTYERSDIKGYDCLEELALDLIWPWNHCGDDIWGQLDASLWSLTRNPWFVLQTVSRDKLESKLSDPTFRKKMDELKEDRKQYLNNKSWFEKEHGTSQLKRIAYFSMEYMLSEALPIYSGGLGNVAGDQLKSASDLGVPVIGIGLLYQKGYFRQLIDKDGNQQATYPYNDPGQLPVMPLRTANGEWLRLEIPLPGWSLWLRVWQVKIGRVHLYLLDSNDVANYPAHRGITSELYGGDSELRLKQEMVLGIGGWKVLEVLGIKPDVCHLNEGHAAFVVLERARSFMEETGVNFEVALAATRAGNVFTTHTAVSAGFDRFSPELIEQYLLNYAKNQLKISVQDLLALGRQDPNNSNEFFNMAYLAIRGSGSVNGVSRLHGQVSRALFEPLFPRWPQDEVPIGYVTNGVHMPSWDSAASDAFWTEACGEDRWQGDLENIENQLLKMSDLKIWKLRNDARSTLVDFSRNRLTRQLAARGSPPEHVEIAKTLFDPHILTLGFARRFATYKRPNMLLQDPERLLRILTNPQRPVQLMIAGKAHPEDKPGQALIKQWIDFIRNHISRPHVVFISDYDMSVTQALVQGVDVWVNNPRRPWEACGTSGMKVLVNGGLNLSELDGWWAEAYNPEIGWALGDGNEHGIDPAWDNAEASALYDILENKVIPEFYTRNEEGIPTSWVQKIRKSMATLTPQYSANRSVREYTEKYYLPAAENVAKRMASNGEAGKSQVIWQKSLEQHWRAVTFGELKSGSNGDQHQFEVQVFLDGLDSNAVKVELFAQGNNGTLPFECYEMKQIRPLVGEVNSYLYQAKIKTERSPADFTARAVPYFADVAVPLEANEIAWQR